MHTIQSTKSALSKLLHYLFVPLLNATNMQIHATLFAKNARFLRVATGRVAFDTTLRSDTGQWRLMTFVTGDVITMAVVEVGYGPLSDDELYDSPSKRKASGSPNVLYYLRNFLTILNHVLQTCSTYKVGKV